MFKRSTKLTALLVAAASVASTVPAMAATKLNTKDGTIEKAVAYKDGKYLYQGYRSDDNDNGLYIGDGSEKDKQLDDADELGIKFGDKYVSAFDGSTEYVVDVASGKISDDDILSDAQDTAETKLENKLDNTDRYADEIQFKKADTSNEDDFYSENKIKRVNGNRFEDIYYAYNVQGGQTVGPKDNKTEKVDIFGYTTEAGKYIDCSYDLNLYAYSTPTTGSGAKGKMVKIEDVEDSADGEQGKIYVTGVKFIKYIGQDAKYIYSVISVDLKNTYGVKTNEPAEETHYYVQKVSKEQGDKKDDAYLPKTTECYEIAKEEVIGNGDVKDAFNVLMLEDGFDKKNVKYAVVDGVIYAYFEDSEDKIKTFKIVLRTSEKLNRYNENGKDKDGKPVYKKDTDSSKISGHVARKDGDKDHDMTEVEEDKNQPWTIDSNGALWVIDEGKIYKSVKMGDFEEVYTCDRSLDSIDVYDENNLIAWDSDGDVYTTVNEGSKAAKEEAEQIAGKQQQTTEPAVTAKTGWDKLADGTWNLYDATGKKVTGWANVGGVWYYMDPTTAVMKTGWVNDNGTWYYCNASGAMQTGWLNDNGTWYYLQSNGAMKTGWFQDTDGRWYYLNANGSMAANTTVDGYVLGANGAWVK